MRTQFGSMVALAAGLTVSVFNHSAQSIPIENVEQREDGAIKQAIANWDKGWATFDAELVSRDYADDAQWTNAFGIARSGRVEIRKYLADLFLNPGILSRKSTPSTTTVRFLRSDIAVASSYRETVGQRTASGVEYPTRKTHDQRVLQLVRGKWNIVSHLIMDEKETRP